MVKPFDASKFRKTLTKAIDGIGFGFNDPTDWVSTGSYLLNYRISGNFQWGIPLGKVTIIAGESGAGKSFIAAGNIVREAQKQGIFVVLIDTENALDEKWLLDLEVDTSEDKLLRMSMSMINDVGKTLSTFMKDYKTMTEEERPKILFVIDSLGALLTDIQVDQFERGDMKGDFGHKPRALKSLVMNCVNMFGAYNVGMVCTNHTYGSQDPYDPDDKISGGSGPIYAASIVIAIKKLKLKTDAEGVKTTKVHGIRAKCKIMKTRYTKPFEEAELAIPYEAGMNPYTGFMGVSSQLPGLLEDPRFTTKQGNTFIYTCLDGTIVKAMRKGWTNDMLDTVMADIMTRKDLGETPDSIDLEIPEVETAEPVVLMEEQVGQIEEIAATTKLKRPKKKAKGKE